MTFFKHNKEKSLRIFCFCAFIFVILSCKNRASFQAAKQTSSAKDNRFKKPNLIVLLIVDQMRPDYIQRFSNAFRVSYSLETKKQNKQNDLYGFNYFIHKGVEFKDARTAAAPTVTAAGHASVCTGSAPKIHGIVGNSFRNEASGLIQEAAKVKGLARVESKFFQPQDVLSKSVEKSTSGPAQLKVTNWPKLLAEHTKGESIAISLKDRGAIFCGKESYWFDEYSGGFLSSSSFMDTLPEWVEAFNSRRKNLKDYVWNPYFQDQGQCHGLESCTAFYAALLDQEIDKIGLRIRSAVTSKTGRLGSVFPYPLLKNPDIGPLEINQRFVYMPEANDRLVDFAVSAISAKKLGADENTDVLSISFSTPDLVGHEFGPSSIELMDIYIRLNLTLRRLQEEIFSRIPEDQVLWVLTADHGVQRTPEALQAFTGKKVGRVSPKTWIQELNSELNAQTWSANAKDLVLTINTDQVYFNRNLPLTPEEWIQAENRVAAYLKRKEGIKEVLTRTQILQDDAKDMEDQENPLNLYRRGYDLTRSGDVIYVVEPGWLGDDSVAGNHGTVHLEDQRIPMAFAGFYWAEQNRSKNTPSNRQNKEKTVRADDIGPTIFNIIGSEKAKHMTGNVLPLLE